MHMRVCQWYELKFLFCMCVKDSYPFLPKTNRVVVTFVKFCRITRWKCKSLKFHFKKIQQHWKARRVGKKVGRERREKGRGKNKVPLLCKVNPKAATRPWTGPGGRDERTAVRLSKNRSRIGG